MGARPVGGDLESLRWSCLTGKSIVGHREAFLPSGLSATLRGVMRLCRESRGRRWPGQLAAADG